MNINYIRFDEINRNAWDNCIATSFNGCLFGYSWYLDLVSERWDALVEDDYHSVMPLCVRPYLGFETIATPRFAYEQGVFSKSPVSEEKIQAFLHAIPSSFRHYRIVMNKYNPIERSACSGQVKRYELDLIKPYHKLAADFDPAIRTQLNQASAQQYSMIMGISPSDLIRIIVEGKIDIDPLLRKENFRLLRTMISGLTGYRSGELYGVYSKYNELASLALFSWMNNRINLMFHVTEPGQQQASFLFLLDRFIEKYSETNATLILECRGSPLSCLDYQGFAARESYLPVVSSNRLPFLLNLFPPS